VYFRFFRNGGVKPGTYGSGPVGGTETTKTGLLSADGGVGTSDNGIGVYQQHQETDSEKVNGGVTGSNVELL